MANPYTSPYHTTPTRMISDPLLRRRWQLIKQHLTRPVQIQQQKKLLLINGLYYIATNRSIMRIKSHLDWVVYTPQDLAQALDTGTVDAYYEQQMANPLSPGDDWRDKQKEMDLKTYYAQRVGRADFI